MTIHVRSTIRGELYSALNGLATTGTNITVSRIVDHITFPSLNIVSGSEEVIDETMNGNQLRSYNVVIEVRAKQRLSLDDEIDGIAAEVETALEADPTLNGEVITIRYQGMDVEYSADQETPIGLMSIRYSVEYLVNKQDPTVSL